jgi:hypothetical protein
MKNLIYSHIYKNLISELLSDDTNYNNKKDIFYEGLFLKLLKFNGLNNEFSFNDFSYKIPEIHNVFIVIDKEFRYSFLIGEYCVAHGLKENIQRDLFNIPFKDKHKNNKTSYFGTIKTFEEFMTLYMTLLNASTLHNFNFEMFYYETNIDNLLKLQEFDINLV